jgi:hypothetical protein
LYKYLYNLSLVGVEIQQNTKKSYGPRYLACTPWSYQTFLSCTRHHKKVYIYWLFYSVWMVKKCSLPEALKNITITERTYIRQLVTNYKITEVLEFAIREWQCISGYCFRNNSFLWRQWLGSEPYNCCFRADHSRFP